MARTQSDLPNSYADRAFRDALTYPDNLRALLRAVAPKIADRLDYTKLEVVGKPYFLDDWRGREHDLLVRLPCNIAEEARELLVCVLVEHQSTADPLMPLRMLVYAVFYWEQEWKAWEEGHEHGMPLRLTPILPVVLHTGQEGWQTNRILADLFDVPAELQGWLPRWDLSLWDLPEHSAAELVQSEEAFWQALAVVRAERAPTEDFLQTLRQALARLESLGMRSRVHWDQLLRMVLHWSLFRRPRAEHDQVLETTRESHATVQMLREVEAMSQITEKTYEEELIEKFKAQVASAEVHAAARGEARGAALGEARGAALGEALGEARGEARGVRFALKKYLEQRFQTIPEDLARRIDAADAQQLQTAFAAALTMSTLDELPLS